MSKVQALLDKLKSALGSRQATQTPQVSIAEAMSASGMSTSVALVRSKVVDKPKFEWTYIYVVIAFLSYATADIAILAIRDLMLPQTAPPARPEPIPPMVQKMRSQYNIITKRNIFNSDGVIPPPLSQPKDQDPNFVPELDGPAVPSTLPLSLIGTIVHKNPGKSVATIEIKAGTPKILPFIPNDEIENYGVLLRVDRKRAIFRNKQTNRNEFIEMKDQNQISFGLKQEKSAETSGGPAAQTEFTLPRSEVNNYIRNLPELLQQARAEPNIVPGTGGRVDGFRVMDIMPGSLYEKLGIRVGDVIKGVNGEAIDSPAKAMELYQSLRNSNRISIEVDRGGSKETLNYFIN